MKLLELFQAVKDETLLKDQLEDYHKMMSEMYAQMHLQMGDLEKNKAIFMLKNPELPNAQMERQWKGSPDGLRQIELKSFIRATSAHLKSLKSRLYSQY